MIRAESTSDSLWAADLTRDMSAPNGKGGVSFKDFQAMLAAEVKVQTKSQKGQTKVAKQRQTTKETIKAQKLRKKAKAQESSWDRLSPSTTES